MSVDQLEKPKSYYELLGLTPQASDHDIKIAYRRLALEHHPDRINTGNRRLSELRFRAINEAYAQLKTSDRRARYNAMLKTRNAAPPLRMAANDSVWSIIAGLFKPSKARP
jgi:curved DNA-binding protein CbpA